MPVSLSLFISPLLDSSLFDLGGTVSKGQRGSERRRRSSGGGTRRFQSGSWQWRDPSLLELECSARFVGSSSDDGGLDEALFDFYMDHKVKCLKRKLSCAGKRNVRLKRSSDFPVCSTFHWIFREIFLRCCRWFVSNV
ncbi:uncharacterized protein LOC125511372 isoform X2 [Triticum urartu]|uniref:uncharacterized protein LOC125511372 isoform X2 n=1 Tax=Triticum urartu TaxID=4572 RepID=UPI002042F28E|nr:uncharacterized protein LOC125511372 isoform X2 [Triticum urartu]